MDDDESIFCLSCQFAYIWVLQHFDQGSKVSEAFFSHSISPHFTNIAYIEIEALIFFDNSHPDHFGPNIKELGFSSEYQFNSELTAMGRLSLKPVLGVAPNLALFSKLVPNIGVAQPSDGVLG